MCPGDDVGGCSPGTKFNTCIVTWEASCKLSCVKKYQAISSSLGSHGKCLDGWEGFCAASMGRGGNCSSHFHHSHLQCSLTVDTPQAHIGKPTCVPGCVTEPPRSASFAPWQC